MAELTLLSAIFTRYGVAVSAEELGHEARHTPKEAITLLLANREISARFDAAHGRPPDDTDVEELLDIYLQLERQAKAGA
jgi:hypothetical protein